MFPRAFRRNAAAALRARPSAAPSPRPASGSAAPAAPPARGSSRLGPWCRRSPPGALCRRRCPRGAALFRAEPPGPLGSAPRAAGRVPVRRAAPSPQGRPENALTPPRASLPHVVSLFSSRLRHPPVEVMVGCAPRRVFVFGTGPAVDRGPAAPPACCCLCPAVGCSACAGGSEAAVLKASQQLPHFFF